MRKSNLGFLAAAFFGLACPCTPMAFAQGSGSSRLSPPRQTRPLTPAEFQQSFWKHITVTSP